MDTAWVLSDAAGTVYTKAQQETAIAAWQSWWADQGLGEGSRVAVLLTPSSQHVLALHALAGLGAIALPIHLRWSPVEIGRWLTATNATHLLWEPATADLATGCPDSLPRILLEAIPPQAIAAAPRAPTSQRTLYWLPTSGSSGPPKPIPLTLDNLRQSASAAATCLPPNPAIGPCWRCPVPCGRFGAGLALRLAVHPPGGAAPI
ncbi:MAG: AMP-binding protein [Oscillatoriales cyanobacterium SM2_1_8]|nr:AMP-binding protein [Oscillatoriales cyanobacterium SM2_1_8]